MIKISIFKNAENLITGFRLAGHANFSEHGSDVVCSAVSALVINTINSIETFTSDRFKLEEDEKDGIIEFHVDSPMSSNANLLLSSLALGLQGVAGEYSSKYIKIIQVDSN
ncbi:MAG: hypothetical protein K0S04_4472 [Herbinix sp.]|jgi:uncharacterized protein YsxB (DUF464 family)|nr:hypothetical protein [Herbinix sp.]